MNKKTEKKAWKNNRKYLNRWFKLRHGSTKQKAT